MGKGENFTAIGDERDIPMALGMIIIVWNACELTLREMLLTTGSKGKAELRSVVEPLVSELGSVGLTQALNCYAHELPGDEEELASAIKGAMKAVDVCRAYRNYYVHSVSGVTEYGIDFSDVSIENNAPLHESLIRGPFGKVYSRTAKGKRKFFMAFISVEELTNFNNYLADLHDYLQFVENGLRGFLLGWPAIKRELKREVIKPLPTLQKPSWEGRLLRPRPALAPWPADVDD